MCWNAAISLNTFIFSVATLSFIAYNNAYTKYKLPEFVQTPWLYALMLSVCSMQLVEYFLWSNIDDRYLNETISIVGSLLLISQPLFLALSVPNINIRWWISTLYSIFAVIFVLAKYPGNLSRFSSVAKEGGLEWRWFADYKYDWIYYLAYWGTAVLCAFYMPTYLNIAIFGVAALALLRWWNGKSLMWASKYCWGLIILSFYYLYRIMISMPLGETMGFLQTPVCLR